MFYLYLNNLIIFIGLIFASYTDLKYREVSNYLSFGLIIYGLIFNTIYFFITKNYIYVLKYWLVFALIYLICYLFWHFGIFAGGDAKLFAGIGAIIPFSNLSLISFGISKIPFVLSLFLLSIVAIFPFGFIKVIYYFISNNNLRLKIFLEFKKSILNILINAIYITGIYFVLLYFKLPIYLIIFVALILMLVPKSIKWPLGIILFVLGFFLTPLNLISNLFFTIIYMFLFFFIISGFKISKSGIFDKLIQLKDLKEGQILKYPLIYENNKLISLKFSLFNEIKIAIKNKKYYELNNILNKRKDLYSKIVINNKFASGLNDEEVIKIKNCYNENTIVLKETIAMVPAILLAFTIMFIFGDLIWYLI